MRCAGVIAWEYARAILLEFVWIERIVVDEPLHGGVWKLDLRLCGVALQSLEGGESNWIFGC